VVNQTAVRISGRPTLSSNQRYGLTVSWFVAVCPSVDVTVTVMVFAPDAAGYECDVMLLVVVVDVPSPQVQSNLATAVPVGVTVAVTGL